MRTGPESGAQPQAQRHDLPHHGTSPTAAVPRSPSHEQAIALGRLANPQLHAHRRLPRAIADPDAVRALRDRLAADGVELVEESDEPDYVSVKCRNPDGYIVEAAWEREP